MKRMQGFICGFLAAIILLISIPALAETIQATFNVINIKINGELEVKAGDSFTLANGNKVPYTIVYNGTTYLPLRETVRLVGKDLLFDGATSTADIIDKTEDKMLPKKEGTTVMQENAITKKQLARWLVQSLGLTENAYTGEIIDVPKTDEYYNDIALVVGNSLMPFDSYHTFNPDQVINRLQFTTTIYYKVWGKSTNPTDPLYIIPDIVELGVPIISCVYPIIEHSFLDLYEDGTFKPNEPLIMDLTPNPDLKNYIQGE